ncbi:amino acid permease 7 [Spatholobus suberectus]|nr:amino acid permease 7 [Spatholobus suberectus]
MHKLCKADGIEFAWQSGLGNLWWAVAHIITGVIGAGVLSLAWSVAQLGWIAGPLITIFFAGTTYVSANLLCDCYRFPHPEYGNIRCPSYVDAVKLYLGEMRQMVCGVLVHVSLYGTTTAYIITSASSIRKKRPQEGGPSERQPQNIFNVTAYIEISKHLTKSTWEMGSSQKSHKMSKIVPYDKERM